MSHSHAEETRQSKDFWHNCRPISSIFITHFRVTVFSRDRSTVLYFTYTEPQDTGVYTCADGTKRSKIDIVLNGKLGTFRFIYTEIKRSLQVIFNKLCLSHRLRLSIIGRLVISPFTNFSNLMNGNSSDYSNLITIHRIREKRLRLKISFQKFRFHS